MMESDHIRGYLISVKKTGENGSSYAVRNPTCYIGRDTNCDIRIRDENINDRHCCIRIESAKKIVVQSLCAERPVSIREIETVEGSQICEEKIASFDGIQIQSGTLIKILDYTFRWVNAEPNNTVTDQSYSLPCNEKLYLRKSDPVLYHVTEEPKIINKNENSRVESIHCDGNLSTAETNAEKLIAIEGTIMNPRISSTVKDLVISQNVHMSPSKDTSNTTLNHSVNRRQRLSTMKTESDDTYEKILTPTSLHTSVAKAVNSPLQESNRSLGKMGLNSSGMGRRSFRNSSVDRNTSTCLNMISNDSMGKLANNNKISSTRTTNESSVHPVSTDYECVTLDDCEKTSTYSENAIPKTQENNISNAEKSILQTPKCFINAYHSTPKYSSQPEKLSFSDTHSKMTDVAVSSQTNSEMFSAVASFTNDNACIPSPLLSASGVISSNEDFNSVESASKLKKKELDSSIEVRRNTRSRSSIITRTLESGENDPALESEKTLTTPEKTDTMNDDVTRAAMTDFDCYSPEKLLNRKSTDSRKSIESGETNDASLIKIETVSPTMLRGTRDLSHISPPENNKSKEFLESMGTTPIATNISLNCENELTLSPTVNEEIMETENESTMHTPQSRCRRSTIEPMVGTPSDVYRMTKCFVTPGNRSHFNRTSLEVQTSHVAEVSRRSERKSTPIKTEKNSVRDSLHLYSPIIENQKEEEAQREEEPYKFVSRRKPRFCKNSFAAENLILEENESVGGENTANSFQPLDSFELDNSIPVRIVVGQETDELNSTFDIENEEEETNRTFEVNDEESQTSEDKENRPKSILTPLPRQQSMKSVKKVTFTGLNESESDGRSLSPYSPQEIVDDMSLPDLSSNLPEVSVESVTDKTAEEDEELYREDEPSELDLELSSVKESKKSSSISPRLSGIKRLFVRTKSPKNSVDMSGIKMLMETPVSVKKTNSGSDVPKVYVQEPTPVKEYDDESFASPISVRRCSKHLRIHRNSLCQEIDTTLVETDESNEKQPALDCSASLNNSMVDVVNENEKHVKANYDQVVRELNERLTDVQKNRNEKALTEDKPTANEEMAVFMMEIEEDEIAPLILTMDDNESSKPNSPIENEKIEIVETPSGDKTQHNETTIVESPHIAQNQPKSEKHATVRFENVSTPVNVEPTAPKRISTPYVRAPLSESLSSTDDVEEYSIVEEPSVSVQTTPQNCADETPITVPIPSNVRTASPAARKTFLTPTQLQNGEIFVSHVVTNPVPVAQKIRTSTPVSLFVANKGIKTKTFYAARDEGTITEISGISVPSSDYVSPSSQADSAESTIVSTEVAVENAVSEESVGRISRELNKMIDELVNEEEETEEVASMTIKNDETKADKVAEMVVIASNIEWTVSHDKEAIVTDDKSSSRSEPSKMTEIESESDVERKTSEESKSEVTSTSNQYKMELILRGSRKSVVMKKFQNMLQGMDAEIVDLRQLTNVVEDDKTAELDIAKEKSNQESHEEDVVAKETNETSNSAVKDIKNEVETAKSKTIRRKRKTATVNTQTVNRSTRQAKNKTKTELSIVAETPVEVLPTLIVSEDTTSNNRPSRKKTSRSKDVNDEKSSKSQLSCNLENVDNTSSVPQTVEPVPTKSKRPKRNVTVEEEIVVNQPTLPTKSDETGNSTGVKKKRATVKKTGSVANQPTLPAKSDETGNSTGAPKKRTTVKKTETVIQSTLPSKTNSANDMKMKNQTSITASTIDVKPNEVDSAGTSTMAQETVIDAEKAKKRTISTRRVKVTPDDNSVTTTVAEQSDTSVKTRSTLKNRSKGEEPKNKIKKNVENEITTVTEEQQPSPRKSKRKKKIDDADTTNNQKEKRKPLTTVLQNIETKEDEQKSKRKNVEIAIEPEKTKRTKRGTKIDVVEEKHVPSVKPSSTKQTRSKVATKSTETNATATIVAVSSPLATRATRNKRKMTPKTVTPPPTTIVRAKRKLNADSEIKQKSNSDSAKSVKEPAPKRLKLAQSLVTEETSTRTRRQSVYSTRSRTTKKYV